MAELDAQVAEYLEFLDELGQPDLADVGAERAREMSAAFRSDPADRDDVAAVADRSVPGPDGDIPVRVYTPVPGDAPYPVLAFFHGGGFVLGDLESHDAACRALANAAECVVVAADYRRAPEHPFPAAVEDCYAVTEWLGENAEAVDGDARLAVGGDSAGGNLAAAVTLLARERRGPAIDAQLLIYPVTSASDHWDSYDENAEGYYLTEADMRWFEQQYFPSELNRANPLASPLRARSHAGLPPATVLTCGFDPLRDEGKAYADALAEDGVPTTRTQYDDLVHGTFTMLVEPGIDRARDMVEDAAAGLREDLSH